MSKPVDPGAAIAEPRAYCLNCRVDGSIYGVRLCTWHHSVREMRRTLEKLAQWDQSPGDDGLLSEACSEARDILARIPEKP